YKGVRTGILCGFEFYRTAIIERLDYLEGLDVLDNLEIIGKLKRKKTHRGALTITMRCVG
ncbi:MAG: hypothetical protein IKZ00_10835, partial [Bacteroidaceae bacterium]|nr:hypothetical protein [Bacteroidaceae bacterium]